ncbi:unnamed protein product [Pieris brassicae]|uniref:Odorant receptor n=1 Tax=Pieris brassicae TaxID=7116 RepID=A0A9P0TGC6_PIEBR|nr:unnamed protein product [Pieris brassicae]
MSTYAVVVILEIFIPSYLGTQLRYRSQKLVNAAYCSEWIARSESFKRSLKLFMLRANNPIDFSGCGLFPLTLDTFTSAVGIYGHMMYNINIDSLIAGLILKVIAQVRIVDQELRNLKSNSVEEEQLVKLNKCLRHYEKPKTFGALMSMLLYMSPYAFVMILQIFVPAYLGTQLRYRSQDLVNAAYCSEWIARSESFKRSLKLFMLRANTPIVFSGCGLFPLTLDTFTSRSDAPNAFNQRVVTFAAGPRGRTVISKGRGEYYYVPITVPIVGRGRK